MSVQARTGALRAEGLDGMRKSWMAGAAVAIATPALAPAAPLALTVGETAGAAAFALQPEGLPGLLPAGRLADWPEGGLPDMPRRLADDPPNAAGLRMVPLTHDLPPAAGPAWGTEPAAAPTFAGGGLPAAATVPEPAAWLLMIAGFGLAGVRLRLQREPA